MTTPTTPKTTAPRKPQDRKASKSDVLQAQDAPPIGHDLLRPVSKLRSGELANAQADLIDIFATIGIDLTEARDETVEIETTPEVLRGIGRLGDFLESYADDLEGYIALDSGPGAQARISDLAMWFLGQMGESSSSAI